MRAAPPSLRGDAPAGVPTPTRQATRDVARDDARIAAAVVTVSALAWLFTYAAHQGGGADTLPTGGDADLPPFAAWICSRAPAPSAALAAKLQWLAGWALMVVAMMLPPALPFLRAMASVATRRRHAVVATAAGVFLLAWTAVGGALLAAGTVVAWLAQAWPAVASSPAWVSGLAAIAAGAYQFTPLKRACLTACRRPQGLILMAWNSATPWRSATRIGMHYAAVCVGCCWALMLLTLTVGAFALPLMVVVSVAMLLERVLPSVRPLIPLQAAIAIAIGALLITQALPAGLGTASAPMPMPPLQGG